MSSAFSLPWDGPPRGHCPLPSAAILGVHSWLVDDLIKLLDSGVQQNSLLREFARAFLRPARSMFRREGMAGRIPRDHCAHWFLSQAP